MHDEPTVYIVDDDHLARDSVRVLVRSLNLKSETFPSAEEFLDHYDPQCAGCLVTDLQMLGMSGMELQEDLAKKGIGIPVIIITAHAKTKLTVTAVKRGAVTVLEKPCSNHELSDAIRDAISLDAANRADAVQQRSFHERLGSLTPQEHSVLEFMIEGAANKVSARRLGVSIRTIENRRQRIFEKTDTKSLAELIRMVVEVRSNTTR